MAHRRIHPALRAALEFGPILGFFVAHMHLKDSSFVIAGAQYDGFAVATAGFIPAALASAAALWALSGRISRMLAAMSAVIVVFGGLSVWLNDPRLFMMKPTAVFALFGAPLAVGLLLGKSWLRGVMGESLPISPEASMILARRMAAFFLSMAALNELVWRGMGEDAWVLFKTFGLHGGTVLFFLLQAPLLRRGRAAQPVAAEGDGAAAAAGRR